LYTTLERLVIRVEGRYAAVATVPYTTWNSRADGPRPRILDVLRSPFSSAAEILVRETMCSLAS
jgi:hypothetical protein